MTEAFALAVIDSQERRIDTIQVAARRGLIGVNPPGVYLKVDDFDGGRWGVTGIGHFDPDDPAMDGAPWLARLVDGVRPLQPGHFPVVVFDGACARCFTLFLRDPVTGVNLATEQN